MNKIGEIDWLGLALVIGVIGLVMIPIAISLQKDCPEVEECYERSECEDCSCDFWKTMCDIQTMKLLEIINAKCENITLADSIMYLNETNFTIQII